MYFQDAHLERSYFMNSNQLPRVGAQALTALQVSSPKENTTNAPMPYIS